ncbi:hypothetical protein EUX98_g6686 [Antrodiella citrinella]|uniref:Clathrin/coatomer adaptor adaptin-like N-terminal domain-containing protein n=1 Tax=Antrodiella citrinella TaxID=2447956 RepID=A0A4S4MP56_9APHY|nr:hypothetical protein EUX98_g6686 [Antrodiella citrinella]
MDVPFSSSGAMNRAHYALVRKVETALSAHAADAMLYAEVEVIQHRLQTSTLTLKQVKESLVTLLYCYTSVHPGTTLDVQFALPHAISLAEAGKSVADKRMGYLFCVEIMPRDHELQLMLVNTLRKDIESSDVPRICLALDTVVHFAPEDVRYFRIMTLLAYRSLSEQGTDILKKILPKMRKRLNDADLSVVHATLTLSIVLMQAKLMSSEHFHPILTKLFRRMWNERADQNARALLLKIMQSIDFTKPSTEDFEIMLEIVSSSRSSTSTINAATPEVVQAPTVATFIKSIRHLLVSESPNDIYLFINCLACLDPTLWAGSVEVPAVLEVRAQIAEALSGEDGESYAQHLVHQLRTVGDEPSQRHILQDAVELSLTHIRSAGPDFRSGCIGVLFTIMTEPEEQLGPTLFTIVAALICEYLDNSPTAPEKILQGLVRLLPLYPAIQLMSKRHVFWQWFGLLRNVNQYLMPCKWYGKFRSLPDCTSNG